MNTSWIKTRQTQFTAYVTLYILIVVGILAAINFLANRYNKSVDTTSNKRFSLSDQTVKIVHDLKQDAKITYIDKTSEFSRAKDLLDRYDTLSPKLKVDYIDPDKKPQIAETLGAKSYGSIFVEIGNKRQEAKALTEEEITSAFIRVLKGGERTACFTTGNGERTLDDTNRSGYSQAKELIERNNYKTRTFSLLEKPEVPKDCSLIVVAGPKFDYPEPVVNALKSYVESGGHALFMLDPPLKHSKEPVAENAGLIKVLEGWGVTVNKDLVLDTSGVGQLFGFTEAVPLVSRYGSHAIVKPMSGTATAFPLARSLEPKTGGSGNFEKLCSTSENSFSTANLASTEIRPDPKTDKSGPLAVAVAGTISAGGSGGAQGRLVVVGSSSWIGNSILRFNGNADLLMNMFNWLSADEELISIRPKDPEDRRLTLNRRQATSLFWLSVVLIPLMSLVAGVAVWWRRR